MPQYPLIANRRAGLWYIHPSQLHDTVYFKSTDGHHGHWDFNIRRMNLHLLEVLGKHNGCIIVDATKKGKKFPDSHSKTIPIWCCVINRAIMKILGSFQKLLPKAWDNPNALSLHLPLFISEAEKSQISALIDSFVDKIVSGNTNILEKYWNLIEKPLRPLWFSSQSVFDENTPLNWTSCDFLPVILLSASEPASETEPLKRVQLEDGIYYEFRYVQGAADDTEWWTKDCSPEVLITNLSSLIKASNQSDFTVHEKISHYSKCTVTDESVNTLSNIGETGLYVTSWPVATTVETYESFDFVINCTQSTPECIQEKVVSHQMCSLNGSNSKYLQLDITEGKKGQIQLFRSFDVVCKCFEKICSLSGTRTPRVLIHCQQGKDRAIAVCLVLLLKYYWKSEKIGKEEIRITVAEVQKFRKVANPSRATMKQLHNYFLKDGIAK